MRTIHSITGGALIAATLVGAAIAEVPDRPEELIFKELNFTPPASGEYRYELDSGVPVYMAPSNEFPLINITFSSFSKFAVWSTISVMTKNISIVVVREKWSKFIKENG